MRCRATAALQPFPLRRRCRRRRPPCFVPLQGPVRADGLSAPSQAQTPEQRRRNAKFVKEQDARRGKSDADVKKLAKEVQKSPISPVWLGRTPRPLPPPPLPAGRQHLPSGTTDGAEREDVEENKTLTQFPHQLSSDS